MKVWAVMFHLTYEGDSLEMIFADPRLAQAFVDAQEKLPGYNWEIMEMEVQQ